tara:strand:+ start:246 stop:728 length:483 start_codon:yes stop_codon:yes gene_type:complete
MPTHAEKRYLDHSPQNLFKLVEDIESYPEFLPWCVASRIRERLGNVVVADLVIGFHMFRERFTSRVILHEPDRIVVEYTHGPLRYLNNNWEFIAEGDGCVVNFYVDFEFRSSVLQKLIGMVFNEALSRMVRAFEERANALYGKPRVSTETIPGDVERDHA